MNGQPRAVGPGTTLAEFVAAEGRGERGSAVAVDGEVVPRVQWPTYVLSGGEAVEIVVAVQGG
jgi:sulfur carrier protein